MKKLVLLFIFFLSAVIASPQPIPVFGGETGVTITGLAFDAMEPFISPDGSTLFFNSKNDGINTGLYYATGMNDSVFVFSGEITGANQPVPPHLDAVASMDSSNNFFWVSTKDYPGVFQNLFTGKYDNGGVTVKTRVYGDIYVFIPGWLIMDAAINYKGNHLYYCNAHFNNCANNLPCSATLSVARKINDTTFQRLAGSDTILKNINDTAYLVYAPQLTNDGLELYFSRLRKGTLQTEVCVSARTDTVSPFGIPGIIYTHPSLVPEAPSLTADKNRLYYHRIENGLFKIFLRYRNNNTQVKKNSKEDLFRVSPNPAGDVISVSCEKKSRIFIYDLHGKCIHEKWTEPGEEQIKICNFVSGLYIIKVISVTGCSVKKFTKI